MLHSLNIYAIDRKLLCEVMNSRDIIIRYLCPCVTRIFSLHSQATSYVENVTEAAVYIIAHSGGRSGTTLSTSLLFNGREVTAARDAVHIGHSVLCSTGCLQGVYRSESQCFLLSHWQWEVGSDASLSIGKQQCRQEYQSQEKRYSKNLF
jgi:hypothetical protein